MDDTYCLDYKDTGFFSGLISDYLGRDRKLEPFYHLFPTIENFEEQLAGKKKFSTLHRQVLTGQLREQYQRLDTTGDSMAPVLENIKRLGGTTTFTVTTGHQLNIFTGPLYFIYKIVSTINLSEALNRYYPEYHFVPVYWMASEDHDFEEINFFNYRGNKLKWEREAAGPVGRLTTEGFDKMIDQLETKLGPGKNARKLLELFRESYLRHDKLADATRFLVHSLFGNKGLVIVDGDDHKLKKLFAPVMEKELLEEASYTPVAGTTDKLKENYPEQVHPRQINLFYIKDGLRERIEKYGDQWQVLNTGIRFTEDQLKKEMERSPECFSPNVVLRPLYQEYVLPNLAYIGGGGELAYWFQLKSMFEKFEVPFPILVLRNSVLWVEKKYQRKMQQLQLGISDLFQPLHQIKKRFVKENAPMDMTLAPYEQKLEQIFSDLEEVARLTDKSMLGAVNAQQQKQLNGLENLRKKLIRAEKRRQSENMQKIEDLYKGLFPGGLQERHDNFISFYEACGEQWLEGLFRNLDPLDFRFRVMME